MVKHAIDVDGPEDEVSAFLEHIGIAGSTEVVTPSTSSGSKSGGKGNFDEGKVKRDKGGKFSKIAGGSIGPKTFKNPHFERRLNALKVKQNQELVDTFGPSILTKSVDDYIAALPPSQDKNGTRRVLGKMITRQIAEQAALGAKFKETRMERAKRAAHDAMEAGGFFAHHGIKGQKWGVRRNVDSATGRVEMAGRTGLTKTLTGVRSTGDVRARVSPAGKTKAKGGTFLERRALNKAIKKGVVKPDLTAQELAKKKGDGLEPRTGSADKIAQDRIQKKIDTVGASSLSNAELQSYTRRLQMEKDVNRALAEQSAAQKAASQSFITSFVKKQAGRQANRVVDKALDVAVEKALNEAGISLKNSNPALGLGLQEVSTRLAPKKKGK
jgi:hypothetical protein